MEAVWYSAGMRHVGMCSIAMMIVMGFVGCGGGDNGRIAALEKRVDALEAASWKPGNYSIKFKTLDRAGIVVCFVPAGTFTMGSNVQADEAEPVRRVYLDGYWIGKTEVTVSQFRLYCDATGYSYAWEASKPRWGWLDGHPMVNVTWDEARAFCKWAGGDLPTEAQWEKAARGTDGRPYPWGNEWAASKCVNSVGSHRGGTSAVERYPSGASPWRGTSLSGAWTGAAHTGMRNCGTRPAQVPAKTALPAAVTGAA